jgi:hypothetical protein
MLAARVLVGWVCGAGFVFSDEIILVYCLPQVPRLAEFVVRGSASATNILLYCLAQVLPFNGFV